MTCLECRHPLTTPEQLRALWCGTRDDRHEYLFTALVSPLSSASSPAPAATEPSLLQWEIE